MTKGHTVMSPSPTSLCTQELSRALFLFVRVAGSSASPFLGFVAIAVGLREAEVAIAVGLRGGRGLKWVSSGQSEITQQSEKLAAHSSSCFPHFLFVSQQDREPEPSFSGNIAGDCGS